jgi:hypothetical protein
MRSSVGDLVGLRQDRNGACGGVDTPLCLGLGHALNAVAARFELELGIRAEADDARDDLLVPAEVRGVLGDHLDLPAVAFREARVHAEQIAGENRRLVAARAGADLEKDVALVVRVLRQQHFLQVGFERRPA